MAQIEQLTTAFDPQSANPTQLSDFQTQINQLQTQTSQLGNQIRQKALNLYDQLDCCSTILGIERGSPNFFFQKYYRRDFYFDLLNYTAWKKYGVMEIGGATPDSLNPSGDNFARTIND